MSIEWLTAIDEAEVSEVQLADGWHSIDVPSFVVSPSDESFSFDETWPTLTRPPHPSGGGAIECRACGRVSELTTQL